MKNKNYYEDVVEVVSNDEIIVLVDKLNQLEQSRTHLHLDIDHEKKHLLIHYWGIY